MSLPVDEKVYGPGIASGSGSGTLISSGIPGGVTEEQGVARTPGPASSLKSKDVSGGMTGEMGAAELRGSILLVDDEELNRDMLSRRLLRSGFSVALASGGREAVELAYAQPFDLVLLDQMMPDVSGAEVLRTLRLTFSAERLPIIMVTAVAESDKIALALEGGANDYITKPIDYKVALARIRTQLARKQAEEKLRQSEERYALAASAWRDGLWDWNLATGEMYFSPRWKQMLGLKEEQVLSDKEAWFSRILRPDLEGVMAAVQAQIDGKTAILECGYRMFDAKGSVRWMACRGAASRDREGRAIRLAGSQNDVTLEKTRDPLTGMSNRLLLIADLECAFSGQCSTVRTMESYGVLFLDVDSFKHVNDSMGHAAGDQMLKSIAGRLQLVVAKYDADDGAKENCRLVAARMGGDEFAFLLRRGATAESMAALAKHVQSAMESPLELAGHIVHCTLSIGMALATATHAVPEDILHDADIAMYTAKRRGRGEVAAFTAEMRDASAQQLDIENDIRFAVERGELRIAYQPKVDLASGLTYGVEALVRWEHPRWGLLQPDAFIRLAEKTGAIVEIGRWVRSGACEQVKRWHDSFAIEPKLELSVNLSPREFKQESLVEELGRMLIATGFPAQCLHLEITEEVLVDDMTAARFSLLALKRLGISLDIDDFGSGYSSLKYLQEMPFDLLKIDRYFLRALDSEQPGGGEGLIESILTIARKLGLKVVAEGIETPEHSKKLQELGCTLGQGYFYSRPIDAETMEAYLTTERKALAEGLLPIRPALSLP